MTSSEASDNDSGDDAFNSSDSSDARASDRRSPSSLSESSDGAVFISSRSEIVISPRRRVSTSTWDAIEPLLSGGSNVLRRVERVASHRDPSRARSKRSTASSGKRDSVKSVRLDSDSAHRAFVGTSSSASEAKVAATRTHNAQSGRPSRRSGSVVGDEKHARTSGRRNGTTPTYPAPTGRAETGTSNRDFGTTAAHDDTAVDISAVAGSNDAENDENPSDSDEEVKPPRARVVRSQKTAATEVPRTTSSRHENRANKKSKADKADKRTQARGRETTRRCSRASSPSPSLSSQSSSQSPTLTTHRKPVSFMSESSNYSEVAAVLPSPKEEMEELKHTLKKLASHSEEPTSVYAPGAASRSSSIGAASHSSQSLEYLRVATAALEAPSTAEQLRLGEFVSQQPFVNDTSSKLTSTLTEQKVTANSSGRTGRHASFDPAALDAKRRRQERANSSTDTGTTSRPKSMMAAGTGGGGGVAHPSSATETRSSLTQKLFGEARGDSRTGAGSFLLSGNAVSASSYGIGSMFGIGSTSGASTGASAGAGAGAVSGSAQGSRAVLSALKALQDKIRRLEEERESLLQQLSDEKVKARKVPTLLPPACVPFGRIIASVVTD